MRLRNEANTGKTGLTRDSKYTFNQFRLNTLIGNQAKKTIRALPLIGDQPNFHFAIVRKACLVELNRTIGMQYPMNFAYHWACSRFGM